MILRLWVGKVPAARAAEYVAYQMEVGPPGYRVIPGCAAIHVLGREAGEHHEVGMLTFWDSLEAVRAFAGDPIERARYYERDHGFLIDPPEEVEHFEVAGQVDPPPGTGADRAGLLRLWRARVREGEVERALEHEAAVAFPRYSAIEGHRGALLATRDVGGEHEIALVSFWSSREAIRAFAGSRIEPSVLAGSVEHFELLHSEAP